MTPADRDTLLHASVLFDAYAFFLRDSHADPAGNITDRDAARRYNDLIRTAKRLRKIAERERG